MSSDEEEEEGIVVGINNDDDLLNSSVYNNYGSLISDPIPSALINPDSVISIPAVNSVGVINDDDEIDDEEYQEIDRVPNVPFPCCPSLSRGLSGVSCLSITNMMLICIVIVGYGMCFSLFSPFFPNEAGKKGMSPTIVGILFGSYELVMFIGTPICGKAVPHLGLRYMLGAGMLLAGGATMLFGVVDKSPNGLPYIILCFAVRVVEAAGASLYLTASYCVAGNMFPDNIAFVYSIMETANGLGSMVGPSAGGLLYTIGGFYLPFVATGGVLLFCGGISTILLPKSAVAGDGDDEDDKALPWSRLFIVSFEVWIIGLTEAVSAILSNYPEPTISIYFEYLGLENPAAIGAVFLASSIVYTIVCVIVGHMADKFPDHVYWMMASGGVIAAASFFIMGPPPVFSSFIRPSIILTAAGEITLYVGISLLLVPVPRALLNAAKDSGYSEGLHTSAMVAGLYNGLWFLGGFAGPPLAGFLLETVGFQWGATIMSCTALALTLMLCLTAAYRQFPVLRQRKQYGFVILDEEGNSTEASENGDEDEGVDNEFNPMTAAPTPTRRHSSVSSFVARRNSYRQIVPVSNA